MQKLLFCAILALSLTSCFNTKLLVGDVRLEEPVVEINRVWNHGVLFGLVPLSNATMEVSAFVGEHQNYVIKTNQSFLNMLVSGVTFGIYTPTQTRYYVPLKAATEK